MPITITLDEVTVGFAVAAAREGMIAEVSTCDALSSEDGEEFTILLESISSCYFARVTPRPIESRIDHFVIIVRSDKTAQIYINEVLMSAKIVPKLDVKTGDLICLDSVADTKSVRLEGVEVPSDAGVLVLVSAGWRKGLFYDFGPLAPPYSRRPAEELERALASLWTRLHFQVRVRLTEGDWASFTSSSWFPFVGISSLRIREMIQFARADWDVDEHLEAIMDDVRRSLGRLRSQIERSSLFDGHRQVVFRALQHFEQGDHVSAATMLYPRIEGVLRGRHSLIPGVGRVSQDALAAGAAADVDERRHPWSLLLPRRFQTYLKEVYFANFDPANPSGVNRNTIGHGIAPENEINGKASTLAVLILEQITFLCG